MKPPQLRLARADTAASEEYREELRERVRGLDKKLEAAQKQVERIEREKAVAVAALCGVVTRLNRERR